VLNRAARVMAAGHGGQILVADSTAGLLSYPAVLGSYPAWPVPGPPLVDSSCFMRRRRQAPTGRHANPTLVGGSDERSGLHQ
jgi:class 3 adenylate cyclase